MADCSAVIITPKSRVSVENSGLSLTDVVTPSSMQHVNDKINNEDINNDNIDFIAFDYLGINHHIY